MSGHAVTDHSVLFWNVTTGPKWLRMTSYLMIAFTVASVGKIYVLGAGNWYKTIKTLKQMAELLGQLQFVHHLPIYRALWISWEGTHCEESTHK